MYSLYAKPKYWITGLLLGTLWLSHRLLPYHLKLQIFRALGRIAFAFNHARRSIANVNLSLCYPDMSGDERDAMVRRNFEHFFVSFVEIAISWWGKDEGMLDNVSFIGTEHFDSALAQGKGVILIGAHFSTIELGAALIKKYIGESTPLHVVYKDQKNALFNAWMLRGRGRHVRSCINSKDSRQIIKTIRSKEIVWYAPDHDHGVRNTVFAPFFGHPAATLTTTATLAKISGAPVIMMGNYRKSDNSGYCVKFQPPLADFPSDDDLQDATRVNQMIEAAISVAPDQYMWIHRRFKTQPGLPKSQLYGKDPHKKNRRRVKTHG